MQQLDRIMIEVFPTLFRVDPPINSVVGVQNINL